MLPNSIILSYAIDQSNRLVAYAMVWMVVNMDGPNP